MDHPNAGGAATTRQPLITAGQTYVTGLINTVMHSPNWDSTAIFLCWDDWGGFYDHVVPPDRRRPTATACVCPALVISPYAKHGYVDHQILSFDAYLKFIEDDFLHGQRIDPRTDGRPDPRPDVRENAPHPRRPRQRLRLRPETPTPNHPPAQPAIQLREPCRDALLGDSALPEGSPGS